MLAFLIVWVACWGGFFFLLLLPVCCWRCHVMSIMGNSSCAEPEPAASDFDFFCTILTFISPTASHIYVVVPST